VEARALDRLTIDPVHNEIYITTSANNILVFPREANGDVAPIRVIGGPDVPLASRPGLRVDPVRNLLVVGGGQGAGRGGGVMVFDRLATGNARPRAIIPGPTTGDQFALYPPTGLIIVNRGGSIEGWNIDEGLRLFENVTGDQKPEYRPRWRVTGQIPARDNRGGGGTGIALNPVHNEILTASQTRNTVWTFSVPEAFQEAASRTAAR
jgi:DNA-binding beta-propeller fold protein YncE